MDVEITGLPEPTVTWFKDDLPLNEASVSTHKVQKMGNCYKLIIENGKSRKLHSFVFVMNKKFQCEKISRNVLTLEFIFWNFENLLQRFIQCNVNPFKPYSARLVRIFDFSVLKF